MDQGFSVLEGGGGQRPKKSELSGWQLSTRKNFPDEVRKSFLRQKKGVNRFRDKKKRKSFFATKKVWVNCFRNKKTCKSFSRQKKYA